MNAEFFGLAFLAGLSYSTATQVIAVVIDLVLRGRGGGKSGVGPAQGDLFTEVYESGAPASPETPLSTRGTRVKHVANPVRPRMVIPVDHAI